MERTGPGLASQEPQAVEALFDDISPTYDLLNRLLSLGCDTRWRRSAARLVRPEPGEVIVDACGGTGDLAIALADLHPDCRVLLVDFAREMLRLGAGKLKAAGLNGRVGPVAGDACRLPLPDASCAAVAAAFGFRNTQSVPAALAEAHRVLRPGGRLAVLEFYRPTGPLAPIMRLALRYAMPLAARLAVGRRAAAYAYLGDSITRFYRLEEMEDLVREAGFAEPEVEQRLLGLVAIMGATRP